MSTRRFRGKQAADGPKKPLALHLELPQAGGVYRVPQPKGRGRKHGDRHAHQRDRLIPLADAIGKPEPWA